MQRWCRPSRTKRAAQAVSPLCSLAALILTHPLCCSQTTILYVLSAALGAAFLPGYALLLAMTEEEAGSERAGAATGVMMMTGNAGGVVISIAMQVLKGDSTEWRNAIWFPAGVLFVALLIALQVRETGRARARA